jgi:hypothetical protein
MGYTCAEKMSFAGGLVRQKEEFLYQTEWPTLCSSATPQLGGTLDQKF